MTWLPTVSLISGVSAASGHGVGETVQGHDDDHDNVRLHVSTRYRLC